MRARTGTACLFVLSIVAGVSAYAQGTKNTGTTPAPFGVLADGLTRQQRDAVQKVNHYFNQLTALKGTFTQTNSDNKRLRGRFYLKRPGLFRFDYSPPSKLVIVSDGKYVAVRDHDLGTDERWDLQYTAFRMLLRKDVDLLRDARFFDIQESADMIALTVVEKGADELGRIAVVFGKAPALQLKEWIAKDAQGFDTRIVLGDITTADDIDPALFNPAQTRRAQPGR
jgi:outer membrane lipoprotein-sorting protein